MPGSGSWTVLEPFGRGGLTTKPGEVVLISGLGYQSTTVGRRMKGQCPDNAAQSSPHPPSDSRTGGLTFPSSAENSAWQLEDRNL